MMTSRTPAEIRIEALVKRVRILEITLTMVLDVFVVDKPKSPLANIRIQAARDTLNDKIPEAEPNERG